jgi:hypothetical protein
MPIRKSRLSRQEEAEYLGCLQHLQAEGLDVEIPEKWRKNAEAVDIEVGAPLGNMVFDLSSGGIGYYAVWLRLVAMRPRIILPDYDITSDFDDQILLLNIDERNPVCQLGGLVFERREILNSHIENGIRFRHRGDTVEGWLLASGLRPIPQQYREGTRVPFQLTFRDQFKQETGVHAVLSVLRSRKQKNPAVRPRTGLYGPAENQQQCELSVGEESRRRYLELVAQDRLAEQKKGSPVSGDLQ